MREWQHVTVPRKTSLNQQLIHVAALTRIEAVQSMNPVLLLGAIPRILNLYIAAPNAVTQAAVLTVSLHN